MKKLLLFFLCFVNYSYSQWVFDNIPEPKIKENGKCIVYYELKNHEYFSNSNIIDWLNSGRKISNTEPLKSGQLYLVEKFLQKESIRNDKFTIQLSKATKLSSGSLTLTPIGEVMSGEYDLGKLTGKIKLLTQYGNNLETSIELDYLNNKIIDQEIIFNSQIINLKEKDINIYPKVIFKNGKVCESTYFIDGNWNYFIEKDKNTIISLCYETTHISRDYFKEKLLECVYYKRDDNNNLNFIKAHIFDLNNILFDTSKILASYNFKNNKLEGVAKIWSKESYNVDKPFRIMNYKNNLLEGEYFIFFKDGKLKEKYYYNNGHLNGPAQIYVSKSDNYDFVFPSKYQLYSEVSYYESNIDWTYLNIEDPKDIIKLFNVRSKSLIVPTALIMGYIGKNYNKNYNDNYYDISSIEYFKFCDLEFVYNEEKKQSILKKYDVLIGSDKFMECEVENCNDCFKIFDKNKKLILSPDIMTTYKNKKVKQSEIENQKLLKTEISCNWCNKKLMFKDALYTDLCNCINHNNESNQLFTKTKYYCSRKCASDGEKQICRENGYR